MLNSKRSSIVKSAKTKMVVPSRRMLNLEEGIKKLKEITSKQPQTTKAAVVKNSFFDQFDLDNIENEILMEKKKVTKELNNNLNTLNQLSSRDN